MHSIRSRPIGIHGSIFGIHRRIIAIDGRPAGGPVDPKRVAGDRKRVMGQSRRVARECRRIQSTEKESRFNHEEGSMTLTDSMPARVEAHLFQLSRPHGPKRGVPLAEDASFEKQNRSAPHFCGSAGPLSRSPSGRTQMLRYSIGSPWNWSSIGAVFGWVGG